MEKTTKTRRVCTACGASGVYSDQDLGGYKKVANCPRCQGPFVDSFYINESGQMELNKPLLIISLEDEAAVPKVFYKGEEVHAKTNILFDWETDTDVMGGTTFAIEFIETDKSIPIKQRIEKHIKGHA